MKRYPVLYPFLFAANFVLLTLVSNGSQVPVIYVLRPLGIILLFTTLLLLLIHAWVKEWERAGFLTLLVLLTVFYYGHLYTLASYAVFHGFSLQQRFIFLTVWLVFLVGIGNGRVWRKLGSRRGNLTNFLNLVSVAIFMVPLYGLFQMALDAKSTYDYNYTKFGPVTELEYVGSEPPDIYYIILDGYASEDVLRTLYDFDNWNMVDFLETRGFYVTPYAQANYMQTLLSISSSLNFEYLNDVLAPIANSASRAELLDLVRHSRARVLLEEAGYQIVTFSSGSLFTEIKDSDLYLSPYATHLNELEAVLLSSSICQLPLDLFKLELPFQSYASHRHRILYTFDELTRISEFPGPNFVFAHIVAPHPPFVFDQTGAPVQPDRPYFTGDADGYRGNTAEYLRQYVDELTFINTLLQQTLDAILAASETPPIILIQADHGPGAYLQWESAEDSCLWERFSIFSAYYLPGDASARLYETITPVNSFRVIFDAYFGTDLGLLPDRSYFSTWNKPYAFQDVTEASRVPCEAP